MLGERRTLRRPAHGASTAAARPRSRSGGEVRRAHGSDGTRGRSHPRGPLTGWIARPPTSFHASAFPAFFMRRPRSIELADDVRAPCSIAESARRRKSGACSRNATCSDVALDPLAAVQQPAQGPDLRGRRPPRTPTVSIARAPRSSGTRPGRSRRSARPDRRTGSRYERPRRNASNNRGGFEDREVRLDHSVTLDAQREPPLALDASEKSDFERPCLRTVAIATPGHHRPRSLAGTPARSP
jgi:hypothetical protein